MSFMDDQPVTQKNLAEALAEMRAELKAELRAEFHEDLAAAEARISEFLKAFFSYQDGANVRMRSLEVKLSIVDDALSERIAIVEPWLSQIEAKLIINRPAA